MTENLQRCPFCGAEPRIYETQFAVKCGDSLCPVKPSVYSNDKDVAVTRWNSRGDAGDPLLNFFFGSPEQLEQFAKDNDYSEDGIMRLVKEQYNKQMALLVARIGREIFEDVPNVD